jgi:hypothetical protein
MHISQLKQSKFLTRADVGKGSLLTIKDVIQENVAKEGAPDELRWCLVFAEADKPMVLNSTNGQIIASITGSEDTDAWIGKQIVAYDDPNVSFGGKLVGGIRCRAPRPQAAKPTASAVVGTHGMLGKPHAAPAPLVEAAEPAGDDVPF